MEESCIQKAKEYLKRMEEYVYKLDVCGERNSYSKTDHDATFMRMKEDAMLNGQSSPISNRRIMRSPKPENTGQGAGT